MENITFTKSERGIKKRVTADITTIMIAIVRWIRLKRYGFVRSTGRKSNARLECICVMERQLDL